MRLREISPEVYAHEVLPHTAPIWSGRRSFDEYAAQTLEIARSLYGRRHFRTVGLYDGGKLVASYKSYERTLHHGEQRVASIGFGAVFTPEQYRGRGYASVMLATSLDRARMQGYQLAFLFSDIRPEFYAALGFHELESRAFSLRADALPSMRLDIARLAETQWRNIRRVFDRTEKRRRAGFTRDAAVWSWIELLARQGSQHRIGRETNLVLRRGGRIAAYVLGVRAPERDAYIVDEFGFADDAAATMVPALLRSAAGDLRRVRGWLPPDGARRLLPKLSVRKRRAGILMMAPLASEGAELLRAISTRDGDFCWPTDHV